jgi:antitoxin component of RelBE/YafQ-DinJ toxin-antitoxin module
MTPTRRTLTFRIDDDLVSGLQSVWERDGLTVSEQVRRAVQDWLQKKGVKMKAERPRAVTRKRS